MKKFLAIIVVPFGTLTPAIAHASWGEWIGKGLSNFVSGFIQDFISAFVGILKIWETQFWKQVGQMLVPEDDTTFWCNLLVVLAMMSWPKFRNFAGRFGFLFWVLFLVSSTIASMRHTLNLPAATIMGKFAVLIVGYAIIRTVLAFLKSSESKLTESLKKGDDDFIMALAGAILWVAVISPDGRVWGFSLSKGWKFSWMFLWIYWGLVGLGVFRLVTFGHLLGYCCWYFFFCNGWKQYLAKKQNKTHDTALQWLGLADPTKEHHEKPSKEEEHPAPDKKAEHPAKEEHHDAHHEEKAHPKKHSDSM